MYMYYNIISTWVNYDFNYKTAKAIYKECFVCPNTTYMYQKKMPTDILFFFNNKCIFFLQFLAIFKYLRHFKKKKKKKRLSLPILSYPTPMDRV